MKKLISEQWHFDAGDQRNPDRLVGKQFVHVKTSNLYVVTGFSLNATNDLWSVQYERSDEAQRRPFPFTRDMIQFMDGRFIEVK